MMRLAAGTIAAVLAIAGCTYAAQAPRGVPVPTVKAEKGATCVEPTDEMRRNHMNMLLHQRDETVHRGVRAPRHSLKGCVECHANPDTHSVLGKEGFCESCHAYASVRMDCFECHSPSPRATPSGARAAGEERAR